MTLVMLFLKLMKLVQLGILVMLFLLFMEMLLEMRGYWFFNSLWKCFWN